MTGTTDNRIFKNVKTAKKADRFHNLMNRAEAIIRAKAGTISELGAELLPDKPKNAQYARAHEWIIQRLYTISRAEVLFRLEEWVERKVSELLLDRKLKSAFNKAMKEISRQRESQ